MSEITTIATENKPETERGESICYRIEARIGLGFGPREIAGKLYDGEWRDVPTGQSPVGMGVPSRLWNAHAAERGYLSYEAAMTLAYWFAAIAEASLVEIRLVEYKFAYSYSIVRVQADEPIAHGAFAYQARQQARPKP